MKDLTIGFAMCGSFCTIGKAMEQLRLLSAMPCRILPILSPIVARSNTRFTNAEALKEEVISLTGNPIISDIVEAEPIGPKKLLDLLIVCPCTGNTMSKIAAGITDTNVTMAVKAQLRNARPVVIAPATNDALSGSARSIGTLLNTRNIYFVPFAQDNSEKKPTSMIADFEQLTETCEEALQGRQIQPILA